MEVPQEVNAMVECFNKVKNGDGEDFRVSWSFYDIGKLNYWSVTLELDKGKIKVGSYCFGDHHNWWVVTDEQLMDKLREIFSNIKGIEKNVKSN